MNATEQHPTAPTSSLSVAEAVAAFVQRQRRNGASLGQVARALQVDVGTLRSILVAVQTRYLLGGGA